MKNKKKLLIAAVLILAIVSIGSYAIYKSTATGTSGFKTAKWYIELNNQDITTSNTFTFDLKAADWTHNAVIDSDETELVVIAPGSYGTFGINIDATETEVDVVYEISAIVKQDDTEIDLSDINPNLSIGFYENDELKYTYSTGSIKAHGTYNGEIRIIWNEEDSVESNSQDININNQDFVIEVTVETRQKENPIVYPEGKSKSTVEVGDIVKIANEEFYVVKHDGQDLILLAHYNLKVGIIYKLVNNVWVKKGEYTSDDYGYGRQSRDAKGYVVGDTYFRGIVSFASTNYWDEKVGDDYPGTYCLETTYTPGTECAYVYDSNSNLYQYVDAYKTYLQEQGATIKEARLLRVEEAFELGCGNGVSSCSNSPANAPSWVYETSYWLGSATTTQGVWRVNANGYFSGIIYSDSFNWGVRPVIII